MKRKILIVDDDESIRKMIGRILIKSGYEVYTAVNGVEAVKKLINIEIDLIILDLVMPLMDGIEFLKAIRSKEIRDIPVLIISGTDDAKQIVEAYKLGAYDFIRKPEHPEILLKRIENGIKIRGMVQFNNSVKYDLLIAKKLQRYLFPKLWAHTEYADIYAWNRPVSDIGGDLFDYIDLRDGRLIFFVADVSGHGIAAALYTAIVKMIFRNTIKSTQVPGEIMTIMNKELSENIPVEAFVTIFCGLFDPEKMIVEYANAGHHMPYLLRGDGVVELEGNGPFLGPIKNIKFNNYHIEVKESYGLIIFTDGVLDICDENDKPVGKSFLLKTLNSKDLTSYEKFVALHDRILKKNTKITDDCTIMLINFKKV